MADQLLDRLRDLAQSAPDLAEAVTVYQVILPLVRSADPSTHRELSAPGSEQALPGVGGPLWIEPVALTADEARAKLAAGRPLLDGIELALDWGAARELLLRMADGLWHMAYSPAQEVKCAIEESLLDVEKLLPLVAAGNRDAADDIAGSLGLDLNLLWTLTAHTLKPALRGWREQLEPLIIGADWGKATCPICGALAALGELQGNDGTRHLRCAMCGADWPAGRMRCVYCGSENPDTLAVLYAEGHREQARIDACDACRGYVKVIAAFDPAPPDLLPVEDLATLHLDYAAQEQGYTRTP